MSPTARWIAAVAGVAAVVVLFVVLRPKDEPGPGVTTTPPTTTPAVTTEPPTTTPPTGPTTTEPTQTPSTPDALEIEVEVEEGRVDVTVEGEPVGGDRTVTVTVGQRVALVVQADRSDEVHVHGYDLTDTVAPGSPARIEFPADVAGIFEVELEDEGTLLLNLEVRP